MNTDSGTKLAKGVSDNQSPLSGQICLAVDSLRPFDLLKIKTANSEYNIFILSPESRTALIQGGRYFSLPVEVTISGANLGGHLHTDGTIEIGRGLEFNDQNRRIVTSVIEEIKIHRAPCG